MKKRGILVFVLVCLAFSGCARTSVPVLSDSKKIKVIEAKSKKNVSSVEEKLLDERILFYVQKARDEYDVQEFEWENFSVKINPVYVINYPENYTGEVRVRVTNRDNSEIREYLINPKTE